ncbi:sigma-54-dependent transcriptional regulator [Microvirga alba]|uniref:Sigma-54-dependent Fis family transcriptional regulator n=1 Tax=Microvirga alba TaxID=2791025 RepID=A0A931BT72_9HYPH|nr:sigma-54 dependent transcriptional regulator [Microvirga alba]MBF9235269.1 sigma-54-dependent Fis family transcriptional regulator [Microvirga alba]
MKPSVLVVDDEIRLAEVLSVALDERGFDTQAVGSVQAAQEALGSSHVDIVLADLRMPDLGGRDLLHQIQETRPDIPVIVMTAYASVRDAVDLVKEGAFDYISKPFEIDDVVATIARALKLGEMLKENRRLRDELEEKYKFENLSGQSAVFRIVLQQITEVCGSRATVLLEGESGTGKELVARAIHYNSPRHLKPFVAVNCAAIPEALLESELFGHTKGAFTGAVSAREGRFALADGGTLFLDEIGDMPISIQAKLLRAIQEQTFEPIGASKSVSVDVRIIAATHKNLRKMIKAQEFREDLYYRLNIFPMAIPPLRDRAEDIPLLASQFLRSFAQDMAKRLVGFTPAAEAAMVAYPWPGNVRELQNCVQRAVIVARGASIDVPDLPRYVLEGQPKANSPSKLPDDLDAELAQIERSFILKALRETNGVQVRAAERLGVTERSLWHRIKKLGIRADHSFD